MRKIFLLLFIIIGINNGYSQEKENLVQIETKYGKIKIKLYNETPLHRDNFLKLVNEGFYNDLLFHRVVKDFMIQGGDPGSRKTADSTHSEVAVPEQRIPAEILNPGLFHKKGALSAARTGNDVNPEKESSSSQFFIVTGKKYSEKDIKKLEDSRIEQTRQKLYNELQAENKGRIKDFYGSGDLDGLAAFRQGLYSQADEAAKIANPLFSAEQRQTYKDEGGTPHLDGEYTVFGQVIEGMDVVDKIQKEKTDPSDRPVNDIKMTIMVLE